MARAVKEKITGELRKSLEGVDGLLVVDTTGFAAGAAEEFRTELRKADSRMIVVKNSLARLVLGELEMEGLGERIEGPSALIYGGEGPLALAKLLVPWGKKNKMLAPRGGYVDGRAVDAAEVDRLSKIPDRPELLSMLLSGLQGPMRALHYAVADPVRRFASLIHALSEKKKETG